MLGSTTNIHKDIFYIKDFALDLGGAIRGFNIQDSTLPNCILRMFKSAESNPSNNNNINYYYNSF